MEALAAEFLQIILASIKAAYIIFFILLSAAIILIIKWALPISNRNITDIKDLKNKRKAVRKQHQQSILISDNECFEEAETTFTLNISETGCFLFTKANWKNDDLIWMKYENSNAVKTGRICRIQTPESNQTPGIGIQFI